MKHPLIVAAITLILTGALAGTALAQTGTPVFSNLPAKHPGERPQPGISVLRHGGNR